MPDGSLEHASVLERIRLVGGGPILGAVLAAVVELARLQRFNGDRLVAVAVEVDAVEVVAAAVDGQVPTPVVVNALVGDGAPTLNGDDSVGPAAQRRFQRGLVEGASLPVVLGQDGKLAHDQRQFAVGLLAKDEFHSSLAHFFHPFYRGVVGAQAGVSLFHHDVEAEDHVFRCYGLAVVPSRLRVERVGCPTLVGRHLDALS